MRDLHLQPSQEIEQLQLDVEFLAEEFEKVASVKRHEGWCNKAASMVIAAGQSKAHSFIRGPSGWVEASKRLNNWFLKGHSAPASQCSKSKEPSANDK